MRRFTNSCAAGQEGTNDRPGEKQADGSGFFTRVFNDHEPADAVAKYVGSQYLQHNPDTPDGAAAFVESTKKLIANNPKISVEIKRVIAEGDLVATRDLVKGAPGQGGFAGIDIVAAKPPLVDRGRAAGLGRDTGHLRF